MSDLIVPAPLWRRLAAASYDGLLLLGLWMAVALIELIVRGHLLGVPASSVWLQALFFGVGLYFFGRSWTRGGQTLGMQAWRLRVRRLDGQSLRWPVAAVRDTTMLATWMLVLTPSLLAIPRLADGPLPASVAVGSLITSLGLALLMQLDTRRRAPCDWISGTETVRLPSAD